MTPTARQFHAAAAAKAFDEHHRAIVRRNTVTHAQAVARGQTRFAAFENARRHAAASKWEAVNHLDRYLEQFEQRILANGGTVAWAETGADACRYVIDLARRRGVRSVVKGKSMATEEIHLNAALEAAGIRPVETDLGEFIVQLRGETPYHIVTPAMHLTRTEIAQTFHDKFGTPLDAGAPELAGVARTQLRQEFLTAEMGVTGANFLVADPGLVGLCTNEGNGRLSLSLPRIHVVIVGIEKIVPRLEDLAVLWPVLATTGTGQFLTCYNTLVGGPRRDGEPDGPEEFHVVLLDNGRSRLLADAEQRDALHCIRCGSCLNACPVYRNVGGHAYGTTYSGPIGSVITPHLRGLEEWAHLSYASSLCGACTAACPVRIDLHHHLLHLRRNAARQRFDQPLTRWAFRAWRWAMVSPFRYAVAGRLARLGLRLGLAKPFAAAWTRQRDLPEPPRQAFRDWWRAQGTVPRRPDPEPETPVLRSQDSAPRRRTAKEDDT
ncbi:lactate utilization protein [bacterium]|nr:lactate utilization protein [bacterium]